VLKPPGKLDDLSHSRRRGSVQFEGDCAFCVEGRRLRGAEGIAKAETEPLRGKDGKMVPMLKLHFG
jgi:hypothetical protein